MAKSLSARSRAANTKPSAVVKSRAPTVLREPAALRGPAALRDVSRSYIPPEDPAEAARFNGRRLSSGAGRRQISEAALASARARMAGTVDDDDVDTDADSDADATDTIDENIPTIGEPFPSVDELEAAADAEDIAPPVAHETISPTAAPPRHATAESVMLTDPDIADGDQLWDWIRGDADRGASLFGAPVTSSLELHARLEQLKLAERSYMGLVRAIRVPTGQLIGFAELNPMLPREQTAVLTIYLAPALRASLAALLPYVVNAMALATPYHLALPAPSPEWADLYERALAPHGFAQYRMFVR